MSIHPLLRAALGALLVGSVALGCGGDDDGDGAGTPDAGGGTAPDADLSDTTAPEVVSIQPAAGAENVMDDLVVLEFSEAIDQESLESEYRGAGFTWNSAGTMVEIAINFPFQSTPASHTFTVPTSVTDLAGNGLAAPFSATFELAALTTVVVEFDQALSGNRTNDCNPGTFITAGDSASDHLCPDELRRAGLSFPLTGLPNPEDIVQLRRATVTAQVISIRGNPNDATLGGYSLDHVTYTNTEDLLDPTLKSEDPLALFQPGEVEVGLELAIPVSTFFELSWTDGDDNLQLRLRPGGDTNEDGVEDTLFLRRGADENDSIVADGLAEPDAGNRMRLFVEYFE